MDGNAQKAKTPAELVVAAADRTDTGLKSRTAIERAKSGQLSLFDTGAYWNDAERALPNEYARAALFTTRAKSQKRELFENHLVFSTAGDVSITYTGSELRASDDQLVWQQLIDFSKQTPVGQPVAFTFREMCEQLGKTPNGRSYSDIKNCMGRLATVVMFFSSKRHGLIHTLRMIQNFKIEDAGKPSCRCLVIIPPEMIIFFAGEHYTRVEWAKYRSVSPTARRLYDYAASHKNPFPLTLAAFHSLCSSDRAQDKYWTRSVKAACAELIEVGLLADAVVISGKIHFQKHTKLSP